MRHAWSRRDVLGIAGALLVAVSITAGVVTPPHRGAVAGGIIACDALGLGDRPHYAPGTVTVLKGDVRWVSSPGPATSVDILPTVVVAQQSVPTGGTYRFDLAPGRYVLEAAPPRGWGPYASVTVSAGDDLLVDIPNPCI